MAKLLQTLADGTAVGALYALIAVGYTLVYGILQFINFAHSDVFALGAWVSFTVAAASGLVIAGGGHAPPPWYAAPLVLLATMSICAAVGLLIERLAYRPLRNAPKLNVLITAIGVSLLLQNTGQLEFARFNAPPAERDAKTAAASPAADLPKTAFSLPFGPYPQAMPTLVTDRIVASILGVDIRLVDLTVLGTAILFMLGIEWLIFRTKAGLAMRAVSFNHRTAALMGINVDRVISLTFALGASLAAAAGFLFAVKYGQLKQTADTLWVMLGLKAFVAAVVGGIGNIRGAMLGGICIGLIEFLGVVYLSDKYRDVYVFSLLILVLMVRPSGILGKATVEKV